MTSTGSLEDASSERARRGRAGENAVSPALKRRSLGASPRTSPSPEGRRRSIPFQEFANSSISEFSLLDSTRLSNSSSKKSCDRNALRVAVRVRPVTFRERDSRIVTFEGKDGELMVVNPKKFQASIQLIAATVSAVSRANMQTSDWLRPFYFDGLFWSDPSVARAADGGEGGEGATQQDVYERIGTRIVDDAMNGFNCSCFAYGHTGTGKTYTIFGRGDDTRLPNDPEALAAAPDGEEFGLVHRVCFQLLRRLHASREGLLIHPEAPSPVLVVQFVEIYNDKIRDLLHPMADSSAFRVREHPETGPYVDNIVPVEVESWSQLRQLLALGCSARKEADTPENNKSSRGHAILTFEIKMPGKLTRVQMVDLAGSERDTVSGGERLGNGRGTPQQQRRGSDESERRALAQRLRESAQIKKALSNLGVIIKGLSRGDTPIGMPFRESTLTWLLKEALSGRAHTTMLATVSPSANDYVETMHTLKYAERLRRANVHFNAGRTSTGPRVVEPSDDSTKKEMRALVKKLGEDGAEARRQVLSLTICDPQQRLAKLTADTPRRRRKFSGGSDLGLGRYRLSPGSGGNSPTSSPGTPPANLFGRPQRTLSPVHSRRPAEARSNDLGAWGSPIHVQEGSVEDFEDNGCSSESKGDEGGVGWEGNARGEGKSSVDDGAGRLNFSDEALEDRGAVGDRGDIDVVRGAYDGGALGGDGRPRQRTFSQQKIDILDELVGDELYSDCAREADGGADADGSWGGNDDDYGSDNSGSGADTVGGAVQGEHDEDWKQDGHAGTGASRPVATAASLNALDVDPGASSTGRGAEHGRGQMVRGVDSPRHRNGTLERGVDCQPRGRSARQRSSPVWSGTSSSEEYWPSGDARASPAADQGRDGAQTFGVGVDDPAPRVTQQVPVQNDVYVTGSPGPPVSVRYDTHVTVNPGAAPTVSVRYDPHGQRDPGPIPSVPVRGEARATGGPSSPTSPASVRSNTHATENPVSVRSPSDQGSVRLRGKLRSVPEASHRDEARGADEFAGSIVPVSATQRDFHATWRRGESSPVSVQGGAYGTGIAADAASMAEAQVGSRIPHNSVASAIRRPGASNAHSTRQVTWWEGDSDSDDDNNDGSDGGSHGASGVGEGEDAAWRGSRGIGGSAERGGRSAAHEGDTISDLRTRLAVLQQELHEQTRRADEANSRAQEAELRSESAQEDVRDIEQDLDDGRKRVREAEARAEAAFSQVGASRDALDGVEQELDETRQRVRETEQRADEAQAKEREAGAHVEDALSQMETMRTDLDGIGQELDETQRRAREAEQRTDEAQARQREAEARAEDALRQVETMRSDLDGVRQELDETRRCMGEAKQRADEAQTREKETEARAEDAFDRIEVLSIALDNVGLQLHDARRRVRGADQRAEEARERGRGAEAHVEDAIGQVRVMHAALDEARGRVREAEQLSEGAQTREREARARAEDALRQLASLRTALDDVGQELDETQRRSRQAEQSADEARERERDAKAHAEDTLSQTEALRTALDEQRAATQEAARRAEQSQEALNSREENEEIALNAARRSVVEEERERASLAESRAVHAAVSMVKEDAGIAVAAARRAGAEQGARRAALAETRADRVAARLEELEAVVDDQEKRLTKAKEDLEEKDRQISREIDDTMRRVMERVRTEVGEVRNATERLEAEKNEAISGMDSAKAEAEELKSRLEAVNKESADAKKEFEEKMKETSRERAALWLAVNKLDVLEAAKDAAIKELQADCEGKSKSLKKFQSQNAALARELEQVDVSLLQALEDNGLSVERANLEGTAMSRRGTRRRQARNGPRGTSSGPNSPARNDAPPPTGDAEDLVANGSRFVRTSAVDGDVERDGEAPWHRPRRTSPPAPTMGRHDLSQAAERNTIENVEEGSGDRGRYGRGVQLGQGGRGASWAGPARRAVFGGSPTRIRPDRWDPAMNTIEREIEQLSERLNGQSRPTPSSDHLPSEIARDPMGGGGVPLGRPQELSTRGAIFASDGGVGKRPRVSPSGSQEAQRARRRGNVGP